MSYGVCRRPRHSGVPLPSTPGRLEAVSPSLAAPISLIAPCGSALDSCPSKSCAGRILEKMTENKKTPRVAGLAKDQQGRLPIDEREEFSADASGALEREKVTGGLVGPWSRQLSRCSPGLPAFASVSHPAAAARESPRALLWNPCLQQAASGSLEVSSIAFVADASPHDMHRFPHCSASFLSDPLPYGKVPFPWTQASELSFPHLLLFPPPTTQNHCPVVEKSYFRTGVPSKPLQELMPYLCRV